MAEVLLENIPEETESPEGPTENSSAKRPVSVRKILANRGNSLKSTGPTSRAGKIA
jgi:hypothetical protein